MTDEKKRHISTGIGAVNIAMLGVIVYFLQTIHSDFREMTKNQNTQETRVSINEGVIRSNTEVNNMQWMRINDHEKRIGRNETKIEQYHE